MKIDRCGFIAGLIAGAMGCLYFWKKEADGPIVVNAETLAKLPWPHVRVASVDEGQESNGGKWPSSTTVTVTDYVDDKPIRICHTTMAVVRGDWLWSKERWSR